MASSQTTVLSAAYRFRFFSFFLLTLGIISKEYRAELIALEELDNRIGPYAIEWHLSPEASEGEGKGNGGGEKWVPELVRLRKRWSTQLRFGKRGVAGPTRQWASQVRFGRK